MFKNCFFAVIALAFLTLAIACGSNPFQSSFEIAVVNDKPSTVAQFTACFGSDTIFSGACQPFGIPIDNTGKGKVRIETGGRSPVNIATPFQCGSGVLITLPAGFTPIILSRDPKRTMDCQFTQPIPAAAGWVSFSDSLDKVNLDENPQVYLPMEALTISSFDELNREAAARSFLSEHRSYERQVSVLYDWLLSTTPPDNTILQNLEAGQSLESQIVLIASGAQFFAASNSDNAVFVQRVYARLLDRSPAQWELDSAVQDLNGYWYLVEESCDEGCLWTMEGYYDCPEPRPDPPCGHWEYYQKTRDAYVWETASAHEFHQVVAGYSYGIQMRRVANASEIEDHAYYIGAYGLKESAVRLLKSLEFFNKSIQIY